MAPAVRRVLLDRLGQQDQNGRPKAAALRVRRIRLTIMPR